LTVTISDNDLDNDPDTDSFTLSTPLSNQKIASIDADKTDAFSVQPNGGLDAGVHSATVTVTGSNSIQASFKVSFTVKSPDPVPNPDPDPNPDPNPAPDPDPDPDPNPAPSPEEQKPPYGISLSPSGVYQFPSVKPNYETADIPSALSVTVTNEGKEPTGPLTVSISTSSTFTLNNQIGSSSIAVASIDKDKTDAFSVRPNSDLKEGPHVAIVTVTGNNKISAVLTVSFTVDPPTKVATIPDEVNWNSGIATVIYTGNLPLTGKNNTDFVVPDGKTLSITGEITNQAKQITTTSGTITNNGTIKTATANNAVLKNLVGLTGTGKVVLTGEVTGIAAPLVLGANLDIGAGGSITYTNTATAAFSGGKKVTIAEGGTLNLGGTGLGTATIDNKGTLTTATDNVDTLKDILAVGGKITASGGNINVVEIESLEIPTGVTLTISITGKLTIASDVKLIVTGTLANNGTLDNKGIIEVPTATKLADVLKLNGLNGKVTVNKTEVTLLSDAIVPIDVELLVPSGQTLRVSEVTLTVNGKLTVNGNLTGDGNLVVADTDRVVVGENGDVTVTGSGRIDVTAKYSLPTHTEIDTSVSATANKNLQGITRTAEKNLEDGVVTIYLGGTVTENETLVETWFGAKGSSAPAGNYAIATIDGIITDAAKATGTVVKNTNPSWQWYKGASHGFMVSDKPTAATTAKHIWLGSETETETAFNWREYGALPNNEFTVILWSGADTKQATLEITPDGKPKYTIIVDWSGLTINEAPSAP
jgi:hypothetical protein